jgi:hypothetical protein
MSAALDSSVGEMHCRKPPLRRLSLVPLTARKQITGECGDRQQLLGRMLANVIVVATREIHSPGVDGS